MPVAAGVDVDAGMVDADPVGTADAVVAADADRAGKAGSRYGGPRSSVPGREFADAPRDPNAQPMAPKPAEHIHDGDDFAFGKIEL